MNKLGFTLIEVLATITIMAIIATMVVINIPDMLRNSYAIKEDNNNSLIEEAACLYIELNKNKDLKENCLNNGCDISVDDLIKEGLINDDIVSNSNFIHIEKYNNEKKCKVR